MAARKDREAVNALFGVIRNVSRAAGGSELATFVDLAHNVANQLVDAGDDEAPQPSARRVSQAQIVTLVGAVYLAEMGHAPSVQAQTRWNAFANQMAQTGLSLRQIQEQLVTAMRAS